MGVSSQFVALCACHRCLREMGTPKFRDPDPHIPSDVGTGGGGPSGIQGSPSCIYVTVKIAASKLLLDSEDIDLQH